MNKHLKILSDFLGLGNPYSKIWFIGLEEGGDPINDTNFEQYLNSCSQFPYFFTIEEGNEISPVWNYISKILLKYKFDSIDKWREYRNIMFCKEHSVFFLSELFPLPKNSYDIWTDFYRSKFGYSQNQIYKYKNDVINYRFPKIRDLWQKTKPIVTICFGKSAWDYFDILFQLNNDTFKIINSFKLYPHQKIIFSPFLGRGHFSNKKVNEIVDIVRKNVVLKASPPLSPV